MPILNPGQRIRDTYEVERMIGEGAFAEVYRVKHRFMGRQAMKVFKAAGTTLEEIERELSEAVLLSSLRHPNIVEVYDANLHEEAGHRFGYFTMTYMPGGTLDRHWRSFGRELMPVSQVVEIGKQTCRALSVAHGAEPPIIHRDIKPQNILIGFSGDGLHVRLSDFGLAKAVNPLTLLASAVGTLGFKPPESLEDVDSCAADVWAVGATLYLLLTDEMPFPHLNSRDVGDARHFLRPLRPPSVFNINVDPALESILYRCLAANAKDRYGNALELLEDLEHWAPSSAKPSTLVSEWSPESKGAMPHASSHDFQAEARASLEAAMRMAGSPAGLATAADLLEEAISKSPDLMDRYRVHLDLWRRGVMHVSTASFAPRDLDEP
ncbi:MAG: serine/threonine-protein kinase [Planctomycetota bacterium]|nr:serine/threonine-protein kinase [Planctomycetota bacterium]